MSYQTLFDAVSYPSFVGFGGGGQSLASLLGFGSALRWARRGRAPGVVLGVAVAVGSCYAVYRTHVLGNRIVANVETIGLFERYDAHWHDLLEVVEQARMEDGVPLDGSATKQPLGPRLRRRAGRKEKMIFALAGAAYLQFGHCDKNLANVLIYRKFMRDELSQYADLRAHNAAEIIDSALHLSFLPSPALRHMSTLMATPAFKERMQLLPGGWWQRWNFWTTGLGVPIARA